ncbi:hypothetical protein GGR58DRAFT_485253 [Xylaria digitata]|nr:hypothetical protein GGR58DRAFT_485253 [Xylaria digitata]
MPARNPNALLQFLVLGISLVSALQVDVIASNSTRSVTTPLIQTVSSTPTASFIEFLSSTTAVDNTEVNDATQGQIINEVNDTINTTPPDSIGLPAGAISIKKGGGAAGTRGSGSSGGGSSSGGSSSSGDGTSNVGSRQGSSSGSSSFSGSGISSSSGSTISSSGPEYPVWFPLGGGLFVPPPGDSASGIGASMVMLRAIEMACATVLTLYGIL